ncbi:unnamed protein product [Leptosia nina]|uniref:Uncharacterized protein n=1 Tax=Leptosia nina TaxID=320188 RepID=A0AAV1JKH9_9NEOP
MKRFLIALSLLAFNLKIAYSQCRQPKNMIMNRIPETIIESPRNFISPPMTLPYSTIDYKQVSSVAPPRILPAPSTTIVTDCSPEVCKNLANTLQLMIVCNLLQNQKGGSDLALQLASPIINDVMASPSFSCGCPNPLFSNQLPNLPPSFVNKASLSGLNVPQNTCPNPGLLNILGLFN